jgi:hypothetical protein
MQRPAVDTIGVSRSYRIVSTRGTLGNAYQRLLAFTTARRKAPTGLLDPMLAHYQDRLHARRPRRSHDPAGDGGRPIDCVVITIPIEPPTARLRGAALNRRTSAARLAAPRRP